MSNLTPSAYLYLFRSINKITKFVSKFPEENKYWFIKLDYEITQYLYPDIHPKMTPYF